MQSAAVLERIIPDPGQVASGIDGVQSRTVKKRIVPEVRETAGEGDAGQVATEPERAFSDIVDAVGDCDARKARFIERTFSDGSTRPDFAAQLRPYFGKVRSPAHKAPA